MKKKRNRSDDSGISSATFSEENLGQEEEEEEDMAGEKEEGGEGWNSDYQEKREERCSVFCKLGVSVPDQPQESFSHSVCLTDWLTAQHLHNPDIDLFSAFFLGVNF